MLDRRTFAAGMAISTICSASPGTTGFAEPPGQTHSAGQTDSAAAPVILKSLKYGMIEDGKTVAEKFAIARRCGFDGIEPNVPMAAGMIDSFREAAEQTGLTVDGTVGGYHWQTRHTDPIAQDKALAMAVEAIEQTAKLGANTFLLVPGHGKDGSATEVRQRAEQAVAAMIPRATELGVSILIENVWNEMFYDPDGGTDQTADELVAFVDTFQTDRTKPNPVGVQFDIGNHWKYGDPAGWIRTLGNRIIKLDIKGFCRATDKFVPITEGDIDWPAVADALKQIHYQGWVAAEVPGGDEAYLRLVSQQVDRALQLG